MQSRFKPLIFGQKPGALSRSHVGRILAQYTPISSTKKRLFETILLEKKMSEKVKN